MKIIGVVPARTAASRFPGEPLSQIHGRTMLEACDSNRILDMEFTRYIAPYPSIQPFSVDSPSDLDLVKAHILEDGISNLY